MGVPRTAPRNALFWRLHGWIDETLAAWQRANGENVDPSRIPPEQHHPMNMALALPPAELLHPDVKARRDNFLRRRFRPGKRA